MLAVTFEDVEAFSREFHANLTKGGIFVPTEETFALRESVEVGLDLRFCGEALVLRGEVVHQVPAGLANAGATPGVAVQFERTAGELRELFEGLVGEIPEPGPAGRPAAPEPGVDRRDAARETARVAARVATLAGVELCGVTRNLSLSGLLFSVTDEPVPVGDAVMVTLEDDEAGESVDIPAEVVRHVEGDGDDVMALGIRFDLDPERDDFILAFLKRVCDLEHTRRLGGITGDIEEVGLGNLLQSFCQSSPVGTLSVIDGSFEGSIAFEHGMLVAAVLGRVRGRKALARMLCFESGRFEFHARVDPALERDAPQRLEAAILEAMREADEAAARRAPRIGPRTRFRVDDATFEALVCDFGKLESAVVDLARVGANVRRLLDVIPEPDARIEEAIGRLVAAGVLQVEEPVSCAWVAGGGGSAGASPAREPRFPKGCSTPAGKLPMPHA